MKVIIEEAITPAVYQEFGDTATLRLEVLDGFTSSDGVLVPPSGHGEIYLEATITIDNDEMHFPALEIDSTEDAAPWDSPNTGDVRGYRVSIITQRGKRIPYFSECKVPILTGGDTSFTWEELRVFNRLFRPRKGHYSQFDRLINVDQVQSMIQAALGARGFASINSVGITALSSPPIDPSFPIALSPTDPEYQELLSGGSVVDVAAQATGGTGTLADPWTGWDTAITWSARTEYHFRSGWFAYATSPNFLKEDIAITGEAGTYLKHTGTGHAFVMDSLQPGVLWIQRARVSNITIVGNFSQLSGVASASIGTDQVVGVGTSFLTQIAVGQGVTFNGGGMTAETRIVESIADDTHLTVTVPWSSNKAGNIHVGKTQNGVHMIGVRNATLTNVSVKDVVNAALYTEWCVTNVAERFVTTYHEPTQSISFQVRPQYGIYLNTNTTTWTFINPIIEGMQTAGIFTDGDAYNNTFINGTSEGNPGKGAVIKTIGNVFIDTDFEANGDTDIEVWQSRNTFINILAAEAMRIEAGQNNRIINSTIGDFFNAGDNTLLDGCLVSGAITDTNGLLNTPYVNTLDGGIRADVKIGNVLPVAVALVAGATVNTNARTGSAFYLAVVQNTTLANPTNLVNGQTLTWTLEAGGSPFTLIFGNKFAAPPGRMLPSVIAPNAKMILVATYSTSTDKLMVSNAPLKSGQDTFAGAGTKAVLFAVNEPDTNYKVNITGNVNETFWVTSKQTTGFTLNSSNAASVAVVDWSVIR
jgi:hypothetical protein